ncbi:MAG: hypothetical protein LC730_04465 [Acidobacteria bacterium]|nr:hypothetical protein [Acidobacteriota bacterium]MCA1608697.1 hypothetical protein [Acidobacteriota bacterium]
MKKIVNFGIISFVFGLMLFGADTLNAQTRRENRREARQERREEIREARRDYREDIREGRNPRAARRELRREVREARRDFRRDVRRGSRGWYYYSRGRRVYYPYATYYYRNGRFIRRY